MSASVEHYIQAIPQSTSDHSAGAIYRSLGVEPIINCAGVRTNYGASNPAPEVIAAMNSAADAFVDLDELADAIGRKLADLTGADWGLVTAGTASSLALAAAACIAGNNPELMLRLPDTAGMRRKVVIPADHRFAYEQALRTAGAEIVSVASRAEFATALDEAAMVCVLGRSSDKTTLPFEMIAAASTANGVPLLVNAAGLSPANQDPWIKRGADLVVYAGGKYIRGPQSTAIVLGSKQLCQAMWWNSAPHQAFGRMMKVGKEEAVGAVIALDRWINSPAAKAERDRWLPRLERIADHLAGIEGVETEVVSWAGSVTATRLKVRWNPALISLDAERLRLAMLDRHPRILIHDFWSTAQSITLDPVNLSDEEAEVVGLALAAAFGGSSEQWVMPSSDMAAIDVSGHWQVEVSFLHGRRTHHLELQQNGLSVTGWHHTGISCGRVVGEVRDREIDITAEHEGVPTHLFYRFNGEISPDDSMSGPARFGGAAPEHLGPVFKTQYGPGTWRATRTTLSNRSEWFEAGAPQGGGSD